jgi:uncharacterized FAD-dependent dehydrogenase
MGFKTIDIKLPTSYSEEQLNHAIGKKAGVKKFSFQIINKSLDARKKHNIHWQIRVGISSDEIKGERPLPEDALNIEYIKRNKKVLVAGAGPAGFFAAYVLQQSGFDVTLVERGGDVNTRAKAIAGFEKSGSFNNLGTYSFGEGGAGTFSDGKLTSRTKRISKEKAFITNAYILAGGPEEIAWLTHPHLGSDNLRRIVKNLREEFIHIGGKMVFETQLTGMEIKNGSVKAAITDKGTFETDFIIVAPGHSSYETYHMLMDCGVQFRTKNFAIGSRAEHPQHLINRAQWGTESLPGVKAAEYRLTAKTKDNRPVYTFCMCPGGIVVPATPYEHTNIVNGMSYYKRSGIFANAACVTGLHPDHLAGRSVTPKEALHNLERLESEFKNFTGDFSAPFLTIQDFLSGKMSKQIPETSYPLGLTPAPIYEMLPKIVVDGMREGLQQFSRKVQGYDQGILLGLESKTSSPVQALRDDKGRCEGFENLFIAGEGSGYAGGIMSSAADGIKVALGIINHGS